MDQNTDKAVKVDQTQLKLPEGYDIINDYQDNIEQAVVDNLFDYFGHTYYKDYDGKKIKSKPKNHFISKYDIKLLQILTSRVFRFAIFCGLFLVLGIVGFVVYYFVAGKSFTFINQRIEDLIGVNGWGKTSWQAIFYFAFASNCLFMVLGISFLACTIYWATVKSRESKRINSKIGDWNQLFSKFSHNLSKNGLFSAIEAAIPNLVFDKHTPIYDRKNYNLQSRIYSFADIPRDAKMIEFKNLFSGFYKGSPFNVSYSSWEWFREAKIINESQSNDNRKVVVGVKRSLRRFEDKICVLTLDTFTENKLNFVLNNPDGRNLRLQNKIFNNIFTLAVNNPKLAYTVFTPYVQHTLARCKTWTSACRSIRQVIKEENKIYVVFDGKPDFFLFDRITNPELNYVFNSVNDYANIISGVSDRSVDSLAKRFKVGSLDETVSLMVEYILEELDILFTSLEMATCFPLDSALLAKQKNKNTLYDILEQKQDNYNNLRFKTIEDLDAKINSIEKANVNFSEPWQPRFEGKKIDLPENKSIEDSMKS